MGGAEPELESDGFLRAATARTEVAGNSLDLSSASSSSSESSGIEAVLPGHFPAPQEAAGMIPKNWDGLADGLRFSTCFDQ